MWNVNEVTLLGYVGQDPERNEVGYPPTTLTKFSVATSERWKAKDGKRQESTEWHQVAAWGPVGEAVAEFIKKGDLVWVRGKLNTQKWQTKAGEWRKQTQVRAGQVRRILASDRSGEAVPERAEEQDTSEDNVPF